MDINLLAICGSKHTGKTTLIEKLLPFFLMESLRVGIIKHDGHTYTPDVPGTDSFRFLQANAAAVATFDAEKCTITRKCTPQIDELLTGFSDMDFILIEGMKHSNYPKIEIIRKEISQDFVSNPQNRLAIVSDCITGTSVPMFHPGDVAGIAAFILTALRAGRLRVQMHTHAGSGGSA